MLVPLFDAVAESRGRAHRRARALRRRFRGHSRVRPGVARTSPSRAPSPSAPRRFSARSPARLAPATTGAATSFFQEGGDSTGPTRGRHQPWTWRSPPPRRDERHDGGTAARGFTKSTSSRGRAEERARLGDIENLTSAPRAACSVPCARSPHVTYSLQTEKIRCRGQFRPSLSPPSRSRACCPRKS